MVVFISCLLNPPKLTSAVLPKTLTSKAQLGRGKEHVRPAAAWSGHGSSNSLEPTWVQTHRGTPNLTSTKPDNPCKICSGRGKVACGTCEGTGRTNGLQYRILPNGMWPKWCTSCRGSGLWYCQRCMGTGIKRDPIGFRLPHEGSESDED